MDLATQAASVTGQLPAQRIDAAGRAHVDQKAVLALALPLMANSSVQIVLNLTDMWFIGHISTQALAAVGQRHLARRAAQQRDAQVLFQAPDAIGERGR